MGDSRGWCGKDLLRIDCESTNDLTAMTLTLIESLKHDVNSELLQMFDDSWLTKCELSELL